MKLEQVEIRVVRLPLLHPFEFSNATITDKIFPLLTLCADGLEGYAEGVMDPTPEYREETVVGALGFLRDTLLPQVLGREFANPQALEDELKIWRGNRMAKAMLEMAFWDCWAKSLGLPLWTLLGGQARPVEVGVSLGIASLESTIVQTGAALQEGYKRVKLKVKPGHDLTLVRAVRQAFPDAHLTVDANSAYRLADLKLLRALDAFNLDYLEQPLSFDDLLDHAALQAQLSTPICLDESILSPEDTRKALGIGAARVINLKVGRVGGHLEARRVHDIAAAFGAPVWCGGMHESGVGRAHNIHLSTLPNFSKPGDTSSASRYFAHDIINEPLEANDGLMPVPPGMGIGVTLNAQFLERATISSETIRAQTIPAQTIPSHNTL
jgi:o-succinylbenzoate synthase